MILDERNGSKCVTLLHKAILFSHITIVTGKTETQSPLRFAWISPAHLCNRLRHLMSMGSMGSKPWYFVRRLAQPSHSIQAKVHLSWHQRGWFVWETWVHVSWWLSQLCVSKRSHGNSERYKAQSCGSIPAAVVEGISSWSKRDHACGRRLWMQMRRQKILNFGPNFREHFGVREDPPAMTPSLLSSSFFFKIMKRIAAQFRLEDLK